MEKKELQKILEEHKLWLTNKGGRRANLRDADLSEANLRRANLKEANMRGAVWDLSVFPLHCESFDMKADKRLCAQLIAHITRIEWEDDAFCAEAMAALDAFKNKFCEYRDDVDKI
jgi:hypothetical protein